MGLTIPERIVIHRNRDDGRGALHKSLVASFTKSLTVLSGPATVNTSFPRETGQTSE